MSRESIQPSMPDSSQEENRIETFEHEDPDTGEHLTREMEYKPDGKPKSIKIYDDNGSVRFQEDFSITSKIWQESMLIEVLKNLGKPTNSDEGKGPLNL